MPPPLPPYAPFSRDQPAFTDQRNAFLAGGDTPRAYLERCLEAIDAAEEHLQAFVTMNAEGARTAADRASERYRAGQPLSLVDGMPLGVKDIFETADMPTQMNSPLYEGWHSQRDAAAVLALRRAGAVLVGKTVTTEFACGAAGPTRNPHDPNRTPGGSSSGSAAAVGAGLIPAALGSQTRGSTLRPASFCGTYGFKPSYGALHTGGVHPVSTTLDHVGVLAGSLGDAWVVARQIAAGAGGLPGFPALAGNAEPPVPRPVERLIWLHTEGWAEIDQATVDSFAALLDTWRAAGVTVLSRTTHPEVEALEAALAGIGDTAGLISDTERRWPYQAYRDRAEHLLSPLLLRRLQQGETVTEADYLEALSRRTRLTGQVSALANLADGLVTLSASGPAPEGLAETGSRTFQVLATLTGLPAFNLPLLATQGMPVGVQWIGFPHRDERTAAHAAWLVEAARRGAA